MTDRLDFPNLPAMTHDRFSPYVAHVRAGEGHTEVGVNPSSVIPTSGPWTYDGHLTDRARLTRCRSCHRPVLEAWCDTVLHLQVDPHRLTPLAELTVVLATHPDDRMLLRLVDGNRLRWRHAPEIRTHPGQGLARHRCDIDRGPPDPEFLTAAPPHRPPGPHDPLPF